MANQFNLTPDQIAAEVVGAPEEYRNAEAFVLGVVGLLAIASVLS